MWGTTGIESEGPYQISVFETRGAQIWKTVHLFPTLGTGHFVLISVINLLFENEVI